MKYLAFVLFFAPFLAQGAVTPGLSEAESDFYLTGSLGDLLVNQSIYLSGTTNASTQEEESKSQSNEQGSLETTWTSAIQNAHSIYAPESGFMRIIGGALFDFRATSSGTWTPNPNLPFVNTATGTGYTQTTFSVTEASEQVTLNGEIFSSTSGTIRLEKEDGEEWTPLFTYSTRQPTSQPPDSFSYSGQLEPGNYRILSSTDYSENTGTAAVFRQTSFTLEVGEAPTGPYRPPQGEYTHPLIGTFFTNPPELTVISPVILSQTPLGNGFTEVRLSASLQNTSFSPWNATTLQVPETFEGGPEVTVIDGGTALTDNVLSFGQIPAESSATAPNSSDSITVQVPDDGLAAFNASILDGSRFTIRGRELWVFLYPVDVMTKQRVSEIASFWVETSNGLTFMGPVDLAPGTILLVNNDVFDFPLGKEKITEAGLINTDQGGRYKQGFDKLLPALIGEPETLPGGQVNYRSAYLPGTLTPPRSLLQFVKHGHIRDHVDSYHESGFAINAGLEGFPVATARPVHFNRLQLPGDIEVSGSVFIHASSYDIEFTMVDGAVKEFLVNTAITADAALTVEATAAVNNEGAPLVEQEKRLFNVDLFTLVLPSGLTLKPELSLDIGASVNVPTSLTVPVHASVTLEATAGMKDGQPYYEQHINAEPPAVSAPTIFKQLDASVSAWAKAQLLVRLGVYSIGVGPTFGVRAGGDFAITPAGAHWWTLNGQLDYSAGIELDLLDLVTLYDEEKVLATQSLFHVESEGGLLNSGILSTLDASTPDNPGIRPVAGQNSRWARILQLPNTTTGLNDNFIFPLAGSTDFLVGGGGDVSRYTANGERLWTKHPPFYNFADAVPHPDGGFVTITTGDFGLTRHDGDGNRIWHSQLRVPNGSGLPFSQAGFPAFGSRPVSSGNALEYFVAGWHSDGVNPNDLYLLKYDDNGNLLWAKVYTPTSTGGGGDIQDLCVTSEGDVILAGYTDVDVPEPTLACPQVLKVNGDDGSVIWAKKIPWSRGGSFTHAAVDEEGNLYFGGTWGNNILDKIPTITISKLSEDGEWMGNVMLGSIAAEAGLSELATGFTRRALPNNGETILDRIDGMSWGEGHLWIAGHIGTGANIPSLSDGMFAFSARLSPKMEVTRYAMHGGRNVEALGAIMPTDDGVLASGFSASFLPWGSTATTFAAGRLIMKLPFEGLLRFHDFSKSSQPDIDDPSPNRGSFYIYPRVFAGSDIGVFSSISSRDLTFTESPLSLEPSPFPQGELLATTPVSHHQIEWVPEDLINNFSTHMAWHQMDLNEDTDGDGMNAAAEYYFGTNPSLFDPVTLTLEPHPDTGVPTLGFPISTLAETEGWAPPIEGSDNLTSWSSILPDGVTLETKNTESGTHLYISPLVAPEESQYFYRLSQPTPP